MDAALGIHIRRLATAQPDFEAALQRVLHWSAETDAAIEGRVAEIIADVRARGDVALLELTRTTRFANCFPGCARPAASAVRDGSGRRRSSAATKRHPASVRDSFFPPTGAS